MLAGDNAGVAARARLERTPLGGEVDVHDAEALGVAQGPLEVVEQRPDEVAAQVDPVADGAVRGVQVGVEVADPLRVGQES